MYMTLMDSSAGSKSLATRESLTAAAASCVAAALAAASRLSSDVVGIDCWPSR